MVDDDQVSQLSRACVPLDGAYGCPKPLTAFYRLPFLLALY